MKSPQRELSPAPLSTPICKHLGTLAHLESDGPRVAHRPHGDEDFVDQCAPGSLVGEGGRMGPPRSPPPLLPFEAGGGARGRRRNQRGQRGKGLEGAAPD